MNEMRSASYRISAPSTVQYQSIISRRRLVCSTICDSFLGDATLSSLALQYLPDRCLRNPSKSTAGCDSSLSRTRMEFPDFPVEPGFFRLPRLGRKTLYSYQRVASQFP